MAKDQGFECYVLSFDYGQRSLTELNAARKVAAQMEAKEHRVVRVSQSPGIGPNEKIRIGVIGVGGYARNVHLPNLRKLRDDFLISGVASRSGATAA